MSWCVYTEHPVALDSPDHLDAAHSGAGNDNSRCPPFNDKLLALYPCTGPAVLDLGCAGGGFVKSLLDAGCAAVGLEGSDYCKRLDRFEWQALGGKNLFTADVTKPFRVVSGARLYDDRNEAYWDEDEVQAGFDVVTCWEVMEHFTEGDLPGVVANVGRHLNRRGLWVLSVSTQEDGKFHRLVRDRAWWLDRLAGGGAFAFRPDLVAHFGEDWVRGPKRTPWAIEAPCSFHLVLEKR